MQFDPGGSAVARMAHEVPGEPGSGGGQLQLHFVLASLHPHPMA